MKLNEKNSRIANVIPIINQSVEHIIYEIIKPNKKPIIFGYDKISNNGKTMSRSYNSLTSRSPTDLTGGHINKNIFYTMFLLAYYAVNKI
jgi:hypothetical protein